MSRILIAAFAALTISQPGVPYTQRFGPLASVPPALAPAVAANGVYDGANRVIQVVDGVAYYQPKDYLVPASKTPFWGINKTDVWSDGKPWISGYQIQGCVPGEYQLQYDWSKVKVDD